ncbi:MAG: thioeseterase [Rhodobacterales bacterium]|nr:MAG: thioeseterase [Rhodobacterales bacterium]
MYPWIRLAAAMWSARSAEPLPLTGTHESRVTCMPWDIDPWQELNNGRTLTLYDLGRLPMGARIGLNDALRKNRWGIAVAGASVRYRKRVRIFERLTMRTRVVGWDERFVYTEQSLWNSKGECASHILIRGAVTDENGIVTSDRLAKAMGVDPQSPPLPGWVQAWIDAEVDRPWPPMPC